MGKDHGRRSAGLKPGHTSTIRRIEGGSSLPCRHGLSDQPFELGLDRLVDLDIEADFVNKQALRAIREKGVSRKQVGVVIDGGLVSPSASMVTPVATNQLDRDLTVYSPRLVRT